LSTKRGKNELKREENQALCGRAGEKKGGGKKTGYRRKRGSVKWMC